MFIEARLNEDYPRLSTLSAPIATAERRVVGRQEEMTQLQAAMARPELCNALLLGPAGAGKSMVVYGVAEHDSERVYREIDPSRVYNDAGDGERMAAMLKDLFVEAEIFVKKEERELVLFIDEVHQLVQLSPPSVEALKPVLAASGRRGIRIIGATTDEEFHQFLAPNLPLVERLQRINLSPPDLETTREILLGMAERYGVVDQFYDDDIFRKICEYTEQYQPASVQPRKSILVLDAMIGWHRLTGEAMDTDLLARVMYNSAGVNVGLKVDGTGIKARLDERVFSQDLATTQLARRLQLSVADLNDKTRPQASFLFAGSTGVGKTELTKQLARLIFGDDQRHLIRFDMTEFANEDSVEVFRSELTKKVFTLPFSVILLDEIEKAHSKVTRVLLQVLDDGRLTDDNNREVSFRNAYVVMTSNAGADVFHSIAHYSPDDQGRAEALRKYDKLIHRALTKTTGDNRFPVELVGRIDAIVPFQPLSRNTQRKVVEGKLRELTEMVLTKHGVKLVLDRKILQYLVEDKGDVDAAAGGARQAVKLVTEEVATAVATFINEHSQERRIRVDVVGDLVSDHKDIRVSDAHLEVSAMR